MNENKVSQLSDLSSMTVTTVGSHPLTAQFNLGREGACEEGDVISDVVLPPWAATPYEFIHLHREVGGLAWQTAAVCAVTYQTVCVHLMCVCTYMCGHSHVGSGV